MKPALFEYLQPRNVEEAVEMLSEVAPKDGRILAGGQSLAAMMAFRLVRPTYLVDINKIAELSFCRVQDDHLSIGALVRHSKLNAGTVMGPTGRLLGSVMPNIAHLPVRNRGTFCGSLAHADPASEWCLLTSTLGASVVAKGPNDFRVIAADAFFTGMMSTALAADEILVEARLPLLSSTTRAGFKEFSRRAGDFALAMVLITSDFSDGRMINPRVGVGAVELGPRRLINVECLLSGQKLSPDIIDAAAEMAANDVEPIEDHSTTADYRRHLVRALARQILQEL